ncbi:hypothetical protein CYL16_06715 [Mycobacterium sp. EPG1]|nr:hypothetical protein CYL16_06715 [Mycobacterium sp. EPG1]
MTALPPDPDPRDVPGVNSAGDVAPGDTPPDSAQTSATSNRDPAAGRNLTPRAVVTFVVVLLFVALFIATGIYLLVSILT